MLSLDFDLSGLRRAAIAVGGVSDEDLPFALAYSLTKAMSAAKQAEVDTMRSVFDNPTRYTLNAFAVLAATKENLSAELYVREFGGTPAWKYLGPQIRGGGRHKKGFERALERAGLLRTDEYVVPTRFAPLDAYGNLRPGLVTRILSDIGANPDQQSNTSAGKRRRRHSRGKGTYFVARARGAMPSGIYFRLGLRDVRMVLAFVRPPNYQARFPYYEVARDVVPRAAVENFHYAWNRWVVPSFRRRLKAA